MSAIPASIPSSHADLVTGPVYAALATHNDDGSIQVTVVWAGADDETLLVNTGRGRKKDRNLRRDPNATLFYLDPANPYRYLSVQGEVVEVIDEDDPDKGHLATETIDDFSELYVNRRPYGNRRPGEVRVLFRIKPVKVLSQG